MEDMEKDIKRIKELVDLLNKASQAYYVEAREIMSNFEYDKLYDELKGLEEKTGFVSSNSPTQTVGFIVQSLLEKEKHNTRMLSLDKTKSVDELNSWIGDKRSMLSWKLDGLTVVLTYQNGELVKAVTRGNGEIGEVITANAKVFSNVPLYIDYKGELVVRGEACIKYSTFNKINETLDVDSKYKNPRNLCSGSVRQLNTKITKERDVVFTAFELVSIEGKQFKYKSEQLDYLESLGFDSVFYVVTDEEGDIYEAIEYFRGMLATNDLPSDGLVYAVDDIEVANSMGYTAKFPKHSMAFKWQDETQTTTIRDIEWSVGRTGVITPVAIFDTVDLEGTEVSRASLHNISIMEELELGIEDEVSVYKANMIIPQIAENFTRSSNMYIPEYCPVCGAETYVIQEKDAKILYCSNEYCPARANRQLTHFVSRDAMNIKGLSGETLDKLVNEGLVNTFGDIFRLEDYVDEIARIEGMGYKTADNIVNAIEVAKYTTMPRFLYALGIPNIGLGNAKLICKEYNNHLENMASADEYELMQIQGIGATLAQSFSDYFMDDNHVSDIMDLLDYVIFETSNEEEYQTFLDKPLKFNVVEETTYNQIFENMTFVCTGSVYIFDNRNQLKDLIESMGGKLTGSVTTKTDYLITNDTGTGTAKNKKASELGVPILSEAEFIEKFNITL